MKVTINILCLTLLFVALPVWAQKEKTIKKQIETGYVPAGNDSLVPDQSEVVKLFDEKGNITDENNTRIFLNQLMVHKRQYFYDTKGCLDSSLIYSNERYAEKLEYVTNEQCKTVSIQEYGSDGKKSFLSKYIYDALGNKVKEEMFNSDNQPYNFKDYVYDKHHNLIDESGSEQGERRYHWTYKYNAKNLLTVRKDYSGNEELLRVHSYQYNKSDRLVRENVRDGKGVLQKVIKIRYEYY